PAAEMPVPRRLPDFFLTSAEGANTRRAGTRNLLPAFRHRPRGVQHSTGYAVCSGHCSWHFVFFSLRRKFAFCYFVGFRTHPFLTNPNTVCLCPHSTAGNY